MNWKAANEQRQNALLRVFYMFIFMTLLVVRAGFDARKASASHPLGLLPQPGAEPPAGSPPSSMPPSHLYPAALRLLRAAEAVMRRLGQITREIHEFLNQAYLLALSPRATACAAQRLAWPSERLDSS